MLAHETGIGSDRNLLDSIFTTDCTRFEATSPKQDRGRHGIARHDLITAAPHFLRSIPLSSAVPMPDSIASIRRTSSRLAPMSTRGSDAPSYREAKECTARCCLDS
ncbi:hypothetical protein ACCO45_003337 [Purpureocillium lilacinum]|uniref:Uncharacterized protein n=1 Tax=Purpureocillium lilacinum TaxID=33203 RepID=A0ACC4E231_PURLI